MTCPPLPAPPAGTTSGSFVEVRTTTLTSAGSTLLPPSFAGALAGGTYQGKRVGTCARVNWGPPVVEKVFAMGVSLCDWKRMTANGTVYYGPIGTLLSQVGLFTILGLPTPGAGADQAIAQVLPLSAAGLPLPSCTLTQLTVPRGYTWLSNTDGSPPDAACMISPQIGDSPRGFLLSGLTLGPTCAQRLQAQLGKPILVPIYDTVAPELLTLAPAYHIVGFAPFVPTGYTSLISLVQAVGSLLGTGLATLTDAVTTTLCTLSACVFGYFTKTLVPRSNPRFGTGNNFGATIIGRTG